MHEKVIRGGRRVEISIYDIVVGDVIPLNIGNQVLDLFLLFFSLLYLSIPVSLPLSYFILFLGPC